MCSNVGMRWSGQELGVEQADALPGLAKLNNLVRSVQTPEFAGVTFHEVLAKSALNKVPGPSPMPFGWTINPYRGCSHACLYCVDPDTSITMSDGREKPLREIEVGDEVLGTRVAGRYRRFTPSNVVAKWSTTKSAYRVMLADGTSFIASGDLRLSVVALYLPWPWPAPVSGAAWTGEAATNAPTARALAATMLVSRLRPECNE